MACPVIRAGHGDALNNSHLIGRLVVSIRPDWHNLFLVNQTKGVLEMSRNHKVKHLAVRPDTHQRYKIISAIRGKDMTEIAEAAVRALEEKWRITLPLEPAE